MAIVVKNKFIYLSPVLDVEIITNEGLPNENITVVPEINDPVKFFAKSIDIGISIGTAEALGLQSAKLQSWYVQPIDVGISGDSYMPENILLDRDNIVTNIYSKIMEYFSEKFFDFHANPRWRLVIENGLIGMSEFEGVISKFDVKETVDNPYLFTYDLKFKGKPTSVEIVKVGKDDFLSDLRGLNV